jgi:hypothetical protein
LKAKTRVKKAAESTSGRPPQSATETCVCPFCPSVFSLRDHSANDVSAFLLHLEKVHRLVLGERGPVAVSPPGRPKVKRA